MAYYPHRVPRAGSLRATWRAAFGSPKLPESTLSGLSRRDAPPTAMQRKLPLALAGWTSAPGQLRTVKVTSGNDCSSATAAAGGLMKIRSALRIRASAVRNRQITLSTRS